MTLTGVEVFEIGARAEITSHEKDISRAWFLEHRFPSPRTVTASLAFGGGIVFGFPSKNTTEKSDLLNLQYKLNGSDTWISANSLVFNKIENVIAVKGVLQAYEADGEQNPCAVMTLYSFT